MPSEIFLKKKAQERHLFGRLNFIDEQLVQYDLDKENRDFNKIDLNEIKMNFNSKREEVEELF